MSRIYSGLNGSNPINFYKSVLGIFRSIKFLWLVKLISRKLYATVICICFQLAANLAGGPKMKMGLSEIIQVYRDNVLISTVDIYQFLSKETKSSNITTSGNDVIKSCHAVQGKVEIIGPLSEERVLFEVKQGRNILMTFFIYTGGFTSLAYQSGWRFRRIKQSGRW